MSILQVSVRLFVDFIFAFHVLQIPILYFVTLVFLKVDVCCIICLCFFFFFFFRYGVKGKHISTNRIAFKLFFACGEGSPVPCLVGDIFCSQKKKSRFPRISFALSPRWTERTLRTRFGCRPSGSHELPGQLKGLYN